jgi:hypothetical protein
MTLKKLYQLGSFTALMAGLFWQPSTAAAFEYTNIVPYNPVNFADTEDIPAGAYLSAWGFVEGNTGSVFTTSGGGEYRFSLWIHCTGGYTVQEELLSYGDDELTLRCPAGFGNIDAATTWIDML